MLVPKLSLKCARVARARASPPLRATKFQVMDLTWCHLLFRFDNFARLSMEAAQPSLSRIASLLLPQRNHHDGRSRLAAVSLSLILLVGSELPARSAVDLPAALQGG